MKIYTESVTWLAYAKHDLHHPISMGQFAGDRQARTDDYYRLINRHIEQIQQLGSLVRLQLLGWSRLDRLEFLEIRSFLEAMEMLRRLPSQSMIEMTVTLPPAETTSTEQLVLPRQESQRIADRSSIAIYDPATGMHSGRGGFYCILADLTTHHGLQQFIKDFDKFQQL